MERRRTTVRIRVDAYTRVCLTAIAVLLTLMVIGLWGDRTPAGPAARAGTYSPKDKNAPDRDPTSSSADKARMEQVSPFVGVREEIVKTNEKLQEILTALRAGEVKVQVVKGEKAPAQEASEGGEKTDKPEKAEGEKDASQ